MGYNDGKVPAIVVLDEEVALIGVPNVRNFNIVQDSCSIKLNDKTLDVFLKAKNAEESYQFHVGRLQKELLEFADKWRLVDTERLAKKVKGYE